MDNIKTPKAAYITHSDFLLQLHQSNEEVLQKMRDRLIKDAMRMERFNNPSHKVIMEDILDVITLQDAEMLSGAVSQLIHLFLLTKEKQALSDKQAGTFVAKSRNINEKVQA